MVLLLFLTIADRIFQQTKFAKEYRIGKRWFIQFEPKAACLRCFILSQQNRLLRLILYITGIDQCFHRNDIKNELV